MGQRARVRTSVRGATKIDERPLEVLRPPQHVARFQIAMRQPRLVQPLQAHCDMAQHLHTRASTLLAQTPTVVHQRSRSNHPA